MSPPPSVPPPSAPPPSPPFVSFSLLEDIPRKHVAHGLLMVIAWGLLFPSGAFISLGWRARFAKGKWFALHRGVQSLGLLLTVIGLIVAVKMIQGDDHFDDPHHIVGLILIILACLQPLNALVRGKPAAATDGVRTTQRAGWELAHKGGGYAMICAGVYQAISGYQLMADGLWLLILYLVLLGAALLFLAVGLLTRGASQDEEAKGRGPIDIKVPTDSNGVVLQTGEAATNESVLYKVEAAPAPNEEAVLQATSGY